MGLYGRYSNQPAAAPVMSVSINDTNSPYNMLFFAEQIFADPTTAAVEVKLMSAVPAGGHPDAGGSVGRTITITDVAGEAGTHSITVTPYGAQTISGAANYVINTDYGSVTLRQNAVGWFVIAKVV